MEKRDLTLVQGALLSAYSPSEEARLLSLQEEVFPLLNEFQLKVVLAQLEQMEGVVPTSGQCAYLAMWRDRYRHEVFDGRKLEPRPQCHPRFIPELQDLEVNLHVHLDKRSGCQGQLAVTDVFGDQWEYAELTCLECRESRTLPNPRRIKPTPAYGGDVAAPKWKSDKAKPKGE